MQTPADKTGKILFATEEDLFSILVKTDHPFRKLKAIIDFDELVEPLRERYSNLGTTGIDVEKGFKALLVQFWEDYSDREMENAVRENIAIRWFCGFSITEDTPDHTYFCKLRGRLGTKRIADVFNSVNESLKQKGLFGNVFTFIDASAIVSKTALWKERDKAIAEGAQTLNNANVSDYAADKDAKWGSKGKNKYWFGYKRSSAVDMRYGLIEKTAVTPAHILDPDVIGSICPQQGMVFTDKLYDRKDVDLILESLGCHAATIRKNNNKQKNKDLDRWRSGIRMPFEGTFSKLRKRAKFRGLAKIVAQNFMESIAHNLKKAVIILPTATAP